MATRISTLIMPAVSSDCHIADGFASAWHGSVQHSEPTIHQIAPYIGKMKSSMARALISAFTVQSQAVYDPFCGSGTVAFEAWAMGRRVVANDLSPYAVALTRAKLFPCSSLEQAMAHIDSAAATVTAVQSTVDLSSVPDWVQAFFHPETLREAIAWSQVMQAREEHFLLSCLLGILHHQRPGFLSYPSSHTVPYLRNRRFPPSGFPELYEYRPVRERLERKVVRALSRSPALDFRVLRECNLCSAEQTVPAGGADAIVTSPPYMRQLDYGRDNRLRLWFIGCDEWKQLDEKVSPSERQFMDMLSACLKLWHTVLKPGGMCVLVLGDAPSRVYRMPLPDAVAHIATKEIGGYSVAWSLTEEIPNNRRVRRGYCGSQTETILVLRNEPGE